MQIETVRVKLSTELEHQFGKERWTTWRANFAASPQWIVMRNVARQRCGRDEIDDAAV
jgi:hypothetical protein